MATTSWSSCEGTLSVSSINFNRSYHAMQYLQRTLTAAPTPQLHVIWDLRSTSEESGRVSMKLFVAGLKLFNAFWSGHLYFIKPKLDSSIVCNIQRLVLLLQNKRWDYVLFLPHLRWCHNGWASRYPSERLDVRRSRYSTTIKILDAHPLLTPVKDVVKTKNLIFYSRFLVRIVLFLHFFGGIYLCKTYYYYHFIGSFK